MRAAPTEQAGECQRIVIKAGDGRVYDLGKPTSPLFRFKLWLYKKRRGI